MRSIEIPQPEDRDWRYRIFEILPGALTWIILSLPIIFGIYSPTLAAYFVISFLLLWFVRALGLDMRSLQGWNLLQKQRKLPWQKLNADLETLEPRTPDAPKWHAENLERVRQYMIHKRILPSEVIHLIIIAAYNESRDIIEPTIQYVLDSDFDMKKVIMILAYEGRDGAQSKAAAIALAAKYGRKFMYAEAIEHPLTEGEVRGKGGNINFAARKATAWINKHKINPDRVIVTTLDSDNRPDRQYFAALTYTFCSSEDPKHTSYQPIPMYLNNIWDAPAPMRVVATGNSFWGIVLSLRPHILRNFSSHSQPLSALIETDYWSSRTIVEDGHQFWRSYFRFDGKYEVYPIFIPIYQDAVLTKTYKRTLRAQFFQVRRWAWGASDIAYFANQAFFKKNNIPKHKLIPKFLRLIETHISWSTAPLLLFVSAYPLFFAHTSNQSSTGYLANQLPQIASKLETLALLGVLVSLFLSMRALPPKPPRYKRHRTIWMVLQWIYLPFTTIIYGAFAAINAQTRLMFRRYIGEFEVTEKAVKK